MAYDPNVDVEGFYKNTQAIGSVSQAIGNNLYGINHQGVKNVLPESRDSRGMVFFTRPQLNLSTGNLSNCPDLYDYLTNNMSSIHAYIRNILDPRLGGKVPFMDNSLAFIPFLTNNIENMSGWPDVVMSTFTSKEGIRRQQWSIADGFPEIYEAFDLDCTFKNTKEDPIIHMLQLWLSYMGKVFEGELSPYIDMITENEIDYNTRIYRLVLDENNMFVKKIAATGASFPINQPSGKFFDYSNSVKYQEGNSELNVRFKCLGAMYNKAILMKEFNESQAIFNSEYRKLVKGEGHNLEKIPYKLLGLLNFRGYPYINTTTLELEWYISKSSSDYKRLLNYYSGKDEQWI